MQVLPTCRKCGANFLRKAEWYKRRNVVIPCNEGTDQHNTGDENYDNMYREWEEQSDC